MYYTEHHNHLRRIWLSLTYPCTTDLSLLEFHPHHHLHRVAYLRSRMPVAIVPLDLATITSLPYLS